MQYNTKLISKKEPQWLAEGLHQKSNQLAANSKNNATNHSR